jgi:hypothetical protein
MFHGQFFQVRFPFVVTQNDFQKKFGVFSHFSMISPLFYDFPPWGSKSCSLIGSLEIQLELGFRATMLLEKFAIFATGKHRRFGLFSADF